MFEVVNDLNFGYYELIAIKSNKFALCLCVKEVIVPFKKSKWIVSLDCNKNLVQGRKIFTWKIILFWKNHRKIIYTIPTINIWLWKELKKEEGYL